MVVFRLNRKKCYVSETQEIWCNVSHISLQRRIILKDWYRAIIQQYNRKSILNAAANPSYDNENKMKKYYLNEHFPPCTIILRTI